MPAVRGRMGFLGADTWRRTLYALLSLPAGFAGFVVTVLSLAVSAVLSVTVVGALCFNLAFALVQLCTRLERSLARRLLRLPAGEPLRREPVRPGPAGRLAARMTDRQSWRDIGFILVNLPVSILAAFVIVLAAVLIVRGITYPFMAWGNVAYYHQAWGGPTYLGAVAVHSVPGLLTVILGPVVIRTVTGLQGRLIQRMIS